MLTALRANRFRDNDDRWKQAGKIVMTTDAASVAEKQVSWDEIHGLCDVLASRLKGAGPGPDGAWTGLVAITRGGLVPAGLLARALDIRRIETLCVASYDEKACTRADILKRPEAAGDGSGWIVVDDLADSGQTFRLAREILAGAVFACLYAKPKGEPEADIFVRGVSQDTWIVFPWEVASPLPTGSGP